MFVEGWVFGLAVHMWLYFPVIVHLLETTVLNRGCVGATIGFWTTWRTSGFLSIVWWVTTLFPRDIGVCTMFALLVMIPLVCWVKTNKASTVIVNNVCFMLVLIIIDSWLRLLYLNMNGNNCLFSLFSFTSIHVK